MKNIYKISLITLIASVVFAVDRFDEVITEETDNIAYQNSIDFDTKTTQIWRDSAWHNKLQWLKSYDSNGYLTESEVYIFRNDEWLILGNVSYTNNDNGSPNTKI